jgi:hypothetical protein
MRSTVRTHSVMALISSLLLLSAAFVAGAFGEWTSSSDGRDPEARSTATMVDPRPDPSITPSDVCVLRNNLNVTSSTFGCTVTMHAIVYNLGASNATDVSIRLGIRIANDIYVQYNHTIFEGISNISSNVSENFVDFNYTWTIPITTWDAYEIWVLVDPENQLDEQNETNNMAVVPFRIDALNLDMVIITDRTEYEAGDVVIYTDVIVYAGTVTPVPLLPGLVFMVVNWYTTAEVPNTRTVSQTADIYGFVIGAIQLPADLVPGMYAVWAEFLGNTYSGYLPTAITVKAHAEPISSIVIAGIVVVIVLAIVAIAVYVMLRKPRPG